MDSLRSWVGVILTRGPQCNHREVKRDSLITEALSLPKNGNRVEQGTDPSFDRDRQDKSQNNRGLESIMRSLSLHDMTCGDNDLHPAVGILDDDEMEIVLLKTDHEMDIIQEPPHPSPSLPPRASQRTQKSNQPPLQALWWSILPMTGKSVEHLQQNVFPHQGNGKDVEIYAGIV